MSYNYSLRLWISAYIIWTTRNIEPSVSIVRTLIILFMDIVIHIIWFISFRPISYHRAMTYGPYNMVHIIWTIETIWYGLYNLKFSATSMLATDVWDEICWRQLWDVSDGFERFCHQHPLYFTISVGHHYPISPISKFCHQHKVTNIHLSPTYV